MKKIFLLTCAAAVFVSPAAWAFKVSFVGIGDRTVEHDNEPNPPPPITTTFGSKNSFGGGALLEFSLLDSVGLELGGLYYDRKSTTETNASLVLSGSSVVCSASDLSCKVTVTSTSKVLEIPVVFRVWLADFLSFGAGGYYAKYMGELAVNTNVTNKSEQVLYDQTSTGSYSSNNRKTYDAGLTASVALKFSLGPMSSLRVEGRYDKGLLNNTEDPGKVGNGFASKFDNMMILAGLTFSLGG